MSAGEREKQIADKAESGREGTRRTTRENQGRHFSEVRALETRTRQYGGDDNRRRSSRQSEKRTKKTRVDRRHRGVDDWRTGRSVENSEKRSGVDGPATAYGL